MHIVEALGCSTMVFCDTTELVSVICCWSSDIIGSANIGVGRDAYDEEEEVLFFVLRDHQWSW
jgi:hypothetical protein